MQILSAKRLFFLNKRLDREVIEINSGSPQQNPMLFREMINACLKGTVEILSIRQYTKSFDTVDDNCKSVLLSVRQHTMLVGSVIGEFCEGKKEHLHMLLNLQHQQSSENKENQCNS